MIYKLSNLESLEQELEELEEIEFNKAGIREENIEDWIEKNPSIISSQLDEEIMIISRQFNRFNNTRETLDLLGLDKSGCLVIIEIKRDSSGTEAHWQAIKYASYFYSECTEDDLYRIYSNYVKKDIQDAQDDIESHIEGDDSKENVELNRNQKIILVAHNFRPEVLSAVRWLRAMSSYRDEDYDEDIVGVDIKCIKITPYQEKSTKDIYLESKLIIPTPEIETITIARDSKENIGRSILDRRIRSFKNAITEAKIGGDIPKWQRTRNDPYCYFKLSDHYYIGFHVLRNNEIRVEIHTRDNQHSEKLESYSRERKLDGSQLLDKYDLKIERGVRNNEWCRAWTSVGFKSLDELNDLERVNEVTELISELYSKFKEIE